MKVLVPGRSRSGTDKLMEAMAVEESTQNEGLVSPGSLTVEGLEKEEEQGGGKKSRGLRVSETRSVLRARE